MTEAILGTGQRHRIQLPAQIPGTGRIDRIWLWAGGRPSSNHAAWVQRRVELGVTDFVMSLNDHRVTISAGRLALTPSYYGDDQAPWAPLRDLCDGFRSAGVAPHVMIFLVPNAPTIEQAAASIRTMFEICRPRSIHLDLEGWWTRESVAAREAGEATIQRLLFESWRDNRPELGVGITCLGGVPNAIRGALSFVDFAIPQMYASERNYGSPLASTGYDVARRHYEAAREALGPRKPICAGQTANPAFVSLSRMRDMLDVVLRLGNEADCIREIAYWQDRFFLDDAERRTFLQSICQRARGGGLTRDNLSTVDIS